MSKRFPDWDVDKARGEEAEALWRELRSAIASGTAEVKRDDRAADTGNVYVEYEAWTNSAQAYEPSGLATTRATTWVFAVARAHVLIAVPTWVLRNVARERYRQGKQVECRVGSHPTRGVTIPLDRKPGSKTDPGLVSLAVNVIEAPFEEDAA